MTIRSEVQSDALKGHLIEVHNPATGALLAKIPVTSPSELDTVVVAARAALAHPDWANLVPHERARFLHRMGALIDRDRDRLARVQMSDNGKTLTECRNMFESAANTFRYYAAVCETHEGTVPPPRGSYMNVALDVPVGVVGAITPWNSPATLEAQKLAPILAAGNAIILKPSEVTPLVAMEYAVLAVEAGFPKGIVTVVTGGIDLGRAMVAHSGIDMISFTGGSAAGRYVAAETARQLKPCVLELGGKSPHIICADADLDAATAAVANGIFSGAGQSCVAGSRIFVEREVLKEVTERLVETAKSLRVGPPDDPTTQIGPLVNAIHRVSVEGHVSRARAQGAIVLTGGAAATGPGLEDGAYYLPTLLTGVGNSADICQQEVFGPVGVILPFDDDADLLAQANNSDYGLASGVWTRSIERAWHIANGLQAGTCWINSYKNLSISTPFQGHKQSGLGREKGLDGMRQYQQRKAVFWPV